MASTRKDAVEALMEFGGCTKERAEELVTAWQEVFASEALSVVAGDESVSSTVADLRVERLRRLVDLLGEKPLPNPYELGVLMRVPVTQARRVKSNWQARHPKHYEDHMEKLVALGIWEVAGGEDDLATWIVEYKSSEVLDYALDRLRRRGIEKGLKADRSALTLEVLQTTTGPNGEAALEVLNL